MYFAQILVNIIININIITYTKIFTKFKGCLLKFVNKIIRYIINLICQNKIICEQIQTYLNNNELFWEYKI